MNWFRKLFSNNLSKKNTPIKAEPIQETTIHMVLKMPKDHPHTLDQVKITGIAKRSIGPNGVQETKFIFYRNADPLTMLELRAAVYWNDCIDSLEVKIAEANKWIQTLSRVTGTQYVTESSSQSEEKQTTLIAGLALLSTHYAILECRALPNGAPISDWLDSIEGDENQADRLKDVLLSKMLAKPLESNMFDPSLIGHLRKSIS